MTDPGLLQNSQLLKSNAIHLYESTLSESFIPTIRHLKHINTFKTEFSSISSIAPKVDDLKSSFSYYRKTKNDGDSFYRAITYAYVESLIIIGGSAIKSFIKLLTSEDGFFHFDDEKSSIVDPITKALTEVFAYIEKEDTHQALELFMRTYADEKSGLCNALVRMLRKLVANFLQVNDDLIVNGVSLMSVVLTEYHSMLEFIEYVVLKPMAEARLVIDRVVPLVLRIALNIVTLDKKEGNFVTKNFPATTANFYYVLKDSLDLHAGSLNLLCLYPEEAQYYIIYAVSYLKSFTRLDLFLNYDLAIQWPGEDLLEKEEEKKKEALVIKDKIQEQETLRVSKLQKSLNAGEESRNTTETPEEEKKDKPGESHMVVMQDYISHPAKEDKKSSKEVAKSGTDEAPWLLVNYNCKVCKKQLVSGDPKNQVLKATQCSKKVLQDFCVHYLCWKENMKRLVLKNCVAWKTISHTYSCCICNRRHEITIDTIEKDILECSIYSDLVLLEDRLSMTPLQYKGLLQKYLQKYRRSAEVPFLCLDCNSVISNIELPDQLITWGEGMTPFACPDPNCEEPIDIFRMEQFFISSVLDYILYHYCCGCGRLFKQGQEFDESLGCGHNRCKRCLKLNNFCKVCIYLKKEHEGKCQKCKQKVLRIKTILLPCLTHRLCNKCMPKSGILKCPLCTSNANLFKSYLGIYQWE